MPSTTYCGQTMKILEIAGAYKRLLFPAIPQEHRAGHDLFVKSFVRDLSRGNVSLQVGAFLTQERTDEILNGLKGHRFSAR
jgi:hypothetical protein